MFSMVSTTRLAMAVRVATPSNIRHRMALERCGFEAFDEQAKTAAPPADES